MRKRYSYPLLFAIPALLGALVFSFIFFGMAAGTLWLYVFGDNPWPAHVGNILMTLVGIIFVTTFVTFMVLAYAFGKKQESDESLNLRHMTASMGATALLILLIGLHQWEVGNLGPKSASSVCSEYCQAQGYAASGLPPRNDAEQTCTCFDARGREAAKLSMEDITIQ